MARKWSWSVVAKSVAECESKGETKGFLYIVQAVLNSGGFVHVAQSEFGQPQKILPSRSLLSNRPDIHIRTMLTHCCCCLPLRLGTFIITSVVAAYGIGAAVVSIIKADDVTNTLGSPAGLWSEVVIHLLIGLAGLAGFLGVLRANARLLKTFSIVYWVQIAVTLTLEAVLLLVAGLHKAEVVDICAREMYERGGHIGNGAASTTFGFNTSTSTGLISNSSTPLDPALQSKCDSMVNGAIGGLAVFIALYAAFQIYCAFVVAAYATKVKGKQRYSMLKGQQLKVWDEEVSPMRQNSGGGRSQNARY
ncbi:hypothetical protein BC938DRAFT_474148 [Jimgerdemannia flammicorona]|uniref:Uncharacterized protein n=1 Tax=Jimgerdemannia flammicorona TaxID=994334 RepID=A0A433Q2T7_9FUNG|nr:hypothetical protein BC938DRAFT_474148 [Jimgerdemannia flammicorona]